MTHTAQSELPLFQVSPDSANVSWMIGLLEQTGSWMSAAEICAAAGKPVTDGNKRWVRALANASQGNIASGQGGYKLVSKMTNDEYNRYRNWMSSQATEMTRRILASDKIFYTRKPIG